MSTQRAVLSVEGLPQQDVRAAPAQAEVPAGQQHHRLATVLADHTLLPLLLLLEQTQQVLGMREALLFTRSLELLQGSVLAGAWVGLVWLLPVGCVSRTPIRWVPLLFTRVSVAAYSVVNVVVVIVVPPSSHS